MRTEPQAAAASMLTSVPPELLTWLEQRHGTGSASAARAQLVMREGVGRGRSLVQQTVHLPATFDGPQQYAVRIAGPHGDWIARATGDERLREVRLREALGRSLPAPLRMAILDVLPLGDGRVLLIEPPLPNPGTESVAQSLAAVRALARLHTGCATFPARLTATLGLVPLGAWLTLYAPHTGVREAALHGEASTPDDLPSRLQPGWNAFTERAPEAWRALAPLLSDPAPLVRALRSCPETLLHGSPSAAVVRVSVSMSVPVPVVDGSAPVVLHDWRQALRAPGALDLATFLAASVMERSDATPAPALAPAPAPAPEELIEAYRMARAEGGRLPASGERWERELTLALLAGALRVGWAVAGADEAVLNFWSDAALAGVALLRLDVEGEGVDESGA